jgi:hypothetical protein
VLLFHAALVLAQPVVGMVTAGPPEQSLVSFGKGLDGVAKLLVDTSTVSNICSGALLPTGRHVVTAAHCVADASGRSDVVSLSVIFETAEVFSLISGQNVIVHPSYSGDPAVGADLAIVVLSALAPSGANRYTIYRADDELGRIALMAGYGVTGRGRRDLSVPFELRRAGSNRLDADGSAFRFPGGDYLLLYDFDNGSRYNDGFGLLAGVHDLGEGQREILPSYGDSGGPTLFGDALVGIHSFGFRMRSNGMMSDVDDALNQSFGEFGADVRLSRYGGWIDAALVPEPGAAAQIFLVLIVLVALRRRGCLALPRAPHALRRLDFQPRCCRPPGTSRRPTEPCSPDGRGSLRELHRGPAWPMARRAIAAGLTVPAGSGSRAGGRG